MVSLLLGDQAALATCTSTWLELLVATLVHVHPMAKPQTELRALLAQCQANTSDGSAAPEVAVYLEPLSTLLPLAADADVQVRVLMRLRVVACALLCVDQAPPIE